MTPLSTENTLIVILDAEPVIALGGENFEVPCIVDGRVFRDCGLGTVVGHYDWLHTSDGQLVGMRTQPFKQPGLDEIITRLARHPWVEVSGSDFCVYCTPTHEFDPDLSLDLEFGLNWILIDDQGTFALAYSTRLRSESEMTTIMQWVKDSSNRAAGE